MYATKAIKRDDIKIILNRYDRLIFYILFGVLVLFTYRDFLLGNRFFLSKNEAMDLYEQFYPSFLSIARDISKGELLPHMDFTRALGQEVNYLFPRIQNLPAYFGENMVGYLLGISQILKVYFAGVFFFEYVKAMKKSTLAAMVTGIGYAFCGQMMLWQWWTFYPVEVLLFAMWLWSFEKAFSGQNKKWLPLCTFIFFLNCAMYYIVLYSIIFTGYYLVRSYGSGRLEFKKLIKYCLFIAVFALIMIGITSFLDEAGKIIKSDRVAAGVSNMSTQDDGNASETLIFTEKQAYITAFYRTVGINNIQGKDNTIWWQGILLDATFYCGILIYLLLPGCIWKSSKKQKICYGMVFAAIACYFAIQPLRTLLNGFSNEGFKLSSFWITVFVLHIVALGLDDLLKEAKAGFAILASVLGSLVIGVIIWNSPNHPTELNPDALKFSMCLIIIYMALLWLFVILKRQRELIKGLLIITVMFEAYCMGNTCITDMDALSAEEYYSEEGYNDNTSEALNYLEEIEEFQDYRVDKQYMSYRFCDSMAQNYFGTLYYAGGLGGDQGTRDFLDLMKVPTISGYTGMTYRTSYGTSALNEASTVLGIKYMLTRNTSPMNFGYDLIWQTDNLNLWENRYALPLGYVYYSYMDRQDFEKLSTEERKNILMETCVLETEDADNALDLNEVKSDDVIFDLEQYQPYAVGFYVENNECYVEQRGDDNVLVLDVSFDLKETAYRGIISYRCGNGEMVNYRIRMDHDALRHIYEINAENVLSVSFFDEKGETVPFDVKECYLIPKEEYYADYINSAQALRESGLDITSFSGRYIAGNINAVRDGIFNIAVPYSNWKIYIDGEKAEAFRTNIGFTGCNISAGEHKVELRYENTKAMLNEAVKVCLLVLILIWMIGQKRKEK